MPPGPPEPPSACQPSDALASDKLWSNVPDVRWPVLIVGFAFAGFTFALYGVLIHRHAIRGRRLTKSQAGVHFFPEKVVYQENILYLGPLMVAFFIVQMCAPELAIMAELFQNTYKALAYYFLMKFTGLQFGLARNAFRDDGSGSLQQHKPCKIWNKLPFCCVWVFFLPFMKERVLSQWDARLIYYLTVQYCYIGPLTAAIEMVTFFEGVKAATAAHINLVCTIVNLISILSAVYANMVYCAIAETSAPIQHQLKQRSWFNNNVDPDDTAAPNKNLSVKSSWISIATVTPLIAGLVVRLVVKDDACLDNGQILLVENRRNYIIAFIAILLNFLAGLFAFTRAFPVPGPENRSENLEFMATKYLDLEIMPAFTMENFPSSIEAIIEERKINGKDPNLGVSSQLWVETFGGGTDDPKTVSAETVGACYERI